MDLVLRNIRKSDKPEYQWFTELLERKFFHDKQQAESTELKVMLIPKLGSKAALPNNACRIGVSSDGTVYADIAQVFLKPDPQDSQKSTKETKSWHPRNIVAPALAQEITDTFNRYRNENPLSNASAKEIQAFVTAKLEELKQIAAQQEQPATIVANDTVAYATNSVGHPAKAHQGYFGRG
jgi:hypothetical protein